MRREIASVYVFNIFISSIISGQSTAKIEELLLEDQNVKRRRERYQKQSSLLSKLTRQLSIHDNRAAAASNWSNGSAGVCKLHFVLIYRFIGWFNYQHSFNLWGYFLFRSPKLSSLINDSNLESWYCFLIVFWHFSGEQFYTDMHI